MSSLILVEIKYVCAKLYNNRIMKNALIVYIYTVVVCVGRRDVFRRDVRCTIVPKVLCSAAAHHSICTLLYNECAPCERSAAHSTNRTAAQRSALLAFLFKCATRQLFRAVGSSRSRAKSDSAIYLLSATEEPVPSRPVRPVLVPGDYRLPEQNRTDRFEHSTRQSSAMR